MFDKIYTRSGLDKNTEDTQFLIRWLRISFIFHIIAAFLSSGFYHADEHFQILEFLNYKLGRSPVADLPIEYHQMMRPWLLPAILYGITGLAKAVGITTPFGWAICFRLFSSLIGWFCNFVLGLCCFHWFSDWKLRNWAILSTCLIWYLPAFHARPSSENLGGSLFFIGLSLSYLALKSRRFRPTPFYYFWIGLLLGLAFEFRYQVAIMIVGLVFWLVFIARISIQSMIYLFLGIGTSVGLGTLIDQWGYQQWTFSPWNYFKYNLIDHHVSDVDTSPWWDYFRRATTESWPVLGLLLLIAFPLAWTYSPIHILTWSTLPFFLVHLWIGHKELRFLFPMIHAGGILVVLALAKVRFSANRPVQILFSILAILNIIGLFALTLFPAWMPIRFYEKLYYYQPSGFNLYFKDDILIKSGGIIIHFYRPDAGFPLVPINQYEEFTHELENKRGPLWLFMPRPQLLEESELLYQKCKIEFSTLPEWITSFKLKILSTRVTNWTLYKCQW